MRIPKTRISLMQEKGHVRMRELRESKTQAALKWGIVV